MKRTVSILMASLAVIVVGCASYEPLASLRGTEVNAPDKASAAAPQYVGGRPGTQSTVARTFSTQPPVIPHAVDNFDEVNLAENQCMDCHGPANFEKKKAPKVGDSHFVAGGKTFDQARHVCTSCHVPQVDAPALVENRFLGNK